MNKNIHNILITGGAGYIGSHIVEQLIKINKNIIILDNLKTGQFFCSFSSIFVITKIPL